MTFTRMVLVAFPWGQTEQCWGITEDMREEEGGKQSKELGYEEKE